MHLYFCSYLIFSSSIIVLLFSKNSLSIDAQKKSLKNLGFQRCDLFNQETWVLLEMYEPRKTV